MEVICFSLYCEGRADKRERDKLGMTLGFGLDVSLFLQLFMTLSSQAATSFFRGTSALPAALVDKTQGDHDGLLSCITALVLIS